MNELFITLGNLIAALGNTQSAAALREHVALLRTQHELLSKRVSEIEEEAARLQAENAQLKQQLDHQRRSKQYKEHRGALFEMDTAGVYRKTPICPVCHKTLWVFADPFPYECSTPGCEHKANFTGGELNKVLIELESL